MNVEFFSFSYAPRNLRDEWNKLVTDVIKEGVFIGGKPVEDFEKEWAEFTGSKFAIGVGNGFDGLTLALRALGIGNNNFVAVPAHTFIASWNAVIAVGAIPLGVDVDDEGLMDLEMFRVIASKVQAVIPVHMHGSAVDMKELYDICSDEKLKASIRIIEDASQAHGAHSPDGSKLGKWSDAVVYSLYPTKNLGALGDAGVITTDSYDVEVKLRSLSNYGSNKENKYIHEVLGYNSRLDPIQAAVLRRNLELLPAWNTRRQYLSHLYIRELSEIIDILQVNRLDSVRHHFCVLTSKRETLREFLRLQGVKSEIHYPRVAGYEAMNFLKKDSLFPKSESIANSILSLPLSQWHNEEQILYVASKVREWISQ